MIASDAVRKLRFDSVVADVDDASSHVGSGSTKGQRVRQSKAKTSGGNICSCIVTTEVEDYIVNRCNTALA